MKEHVLPFQNSPVIQFFQCLVFVVIEAVAIQKGSANNLINLAFTFIYSSKLTTNNLINSTISILPANYTCQLYLLFTASKNINQNKSYNLTNIQNKTHYYSDV